MTKIDIVSGFLGAGKTTFIQKLLDEVLKSEQVVLIENEFGEIGIDGGFLKDSGIEIREMNQGCICCSLVGDFETSLKEVVDTYHPDRIIIEPSGVGKLSDIIAAVKSISKNMDVELHAAVTMVDARKVKMYSRNFGEFFNNQIEYAGTIVLSRTDITEEAKVLEAAEVVRSINRQASVITTAIAELAGPQLLEIISRPDTMEEDLLKEVMERVREHEREQEAGDHEHGEDHDHEHHEHHHHHGHEEGHDEEHEHEGHHHGHGESRHHGEEDGESHEHHHHHGEDHEEAHHHEEGHGHHHGHEDHEHEGHHGHGEGHGHHHHHHDHSHSSEEILEDGTRIHHHDHSHHHHHHDGEHDADEIFTSWGLETPRAFSEEKLQGILDEMAESEKYGMVVRCKGMLPTEEQGKWMYFDMVPEQTEIRTGRPDYTGKVVVIGADLKEELLQKAFLS